MVYSSVQLQYALDRLRISPELLRRINFHADERFFHPMPLQSACPRQICSAGLEWRDYPTLIDASRSVAGIEIKLAAASPWSKHRNETEGRTLPENVSAKRYEYAQLRELYAQSAAVAVPLYENDFQAGVTTILEAMAMGRPVIVTRTTGQVDVVRDNETGITVAPGDTDGWADAINTVFDNPVEMAQMGNRGREWLLANATLTKWCDVIADEILGGTAVRTNATDRHHAPGKFNLARARADSMRSDK
jgi:glycosyltransferase involved in cell wall biosynthesis